MPRLTVADGLPRDARSDSACAHAAAPDDGGAFRIRTDIEDGLAAQKLDSACRLQKAHHDRRIGVEIDIRVALHRLSAYASASVRATSARRGRDVENR
ncbi:hypothetical protein GCM10007887_13080 [Methylobacterium haplocladii]|uniref:Uncharacterized protein n=1 Tax=Methylobacterium haplocladii TaxID=1176176 RepID=A0A512IPX3_9HYPH|nr:hypothetical protein MHA02_21180 [Methylobacterium haplocladii]GLS58644.1 hypothetical protein GCM10007887_13080 [Methylobacterium haplocladii]